jgi:hypothetical protein
MERLAFAKRLIKEHKVQTDKLIAMIGTHPHREDLRDRDYLLQLPEIFSADFDLASFNKDAVEQNMQDLSEKANWIHQDGMEAAWLLVECDPMMAQLKQKFCYFSREGLRTEQIIEHFMENGLEKPVTSENPIAFIVNSLMASNVQEVVKKSCAHVIDSVDVLVARPASEEIEAKLFNDTPQQRAMTKLFHFYRLLGIITK